MQLNLHITFLSFIKYCIIKLIITQNLILKNIILLFFKITLIFHHSLTVQLHKNVRHQSLLQNVWTYELHVSSLRKQTLDWKIHQIGGTSQDRKHATAWRLTLKNPWYSNRNQLHLGLDHPLYLSIVSRCHPLLGYERTRSHGILLKEWLEVSCHRLLLSAIFNVRTTHRQKLNIKTQAFPQSVKTQTYLFKYHPLQSLVWIPHLRM